MSCRHYSTSRNECVDMRILLKVKCLGVLIRICINMFFHSAPPRGKPSRFRRTMSEHSLASPQGGEWSKCGGPPGGFPASARSGPGHQDVSGGVATRSVSEEWFAPGGSGPPIYAPPLSRVTRSATELVRTAPLSIQMWYFAWGS